MNRMRLHIAAFGLAALAGCSSSSDSGDQDARPNFLILDAAGRLTALPEEPTDSTSLVFRHVGGDLYLQTTEITQAQWMAQVGSTPWGVFGIASRPAAPAQGLSRDLATAAAATLATRSGERVRLPTASEWTLAVGPRNAEAPIISAETATQAAVVTSDTGIYRHTYGNVRELVASGWIGGSYLDLDRVIDNQVRSSIDADVAHPLLGVRFALEWSR